MDAILKQVWKDAQGMRDTLVAWRRDLHRHPELAFREVRTAEVIAHHLRDLGLEVQAGVAKTGVVAIIEGNEPGPTVMLRFDIDALPIEEENDVPYRSANPGVMHACGHDGHVAIGLGAATLIHRYRDALRGRVKLIFQPAEEIGQGARRMIQAGVLENPYPEVAFGLHLWSGLPTGQVAVRSGPLMASATEFQVEVVGQAGHGAQPHLTVDALVAGVHIVSALQTVVSRNVDPLETLVVTVGEMHAGTAFNIVAGRAILRGTVRAFKPAVMDLAYARIRSLAEGIAQAHGARAEVQVEVITPTVVNDSRAAAIVHRAATAVVGADQVISPQPVMVSEDMGEFLERVPGCFFFVGARNEDRGIIYAHHHPRFDLDEDALPIGLATIVAAALLAGAGEPVDRTSRSVS